jgi:hypothetical protein
MAVVDTYGLVETDEGLASRHAGGELPVAADVGVSEAAREAVGLLRAE